MIFIAIILQNGTEDLTGRYLGVFVELYDGYSQTAMLVVYTLDCCMWSYSFNLLCSFVVFKNICVCVIVKITMRN